MKILTDMVLGVIAGGAACLAFFGITAFVINATDGLRYRNLNYNPKYSARDKKK